MIFSNRLPSGLNHFLSRSLALAVASSVVIFGGVAAHLGVDNVAYAQTNSDRTPTAAPTPNNPPVANPNNNTEILNYARSLIAIENIRQQAYNDIKNIVGEGQPVPGVVCSEASSLDGLNRELREIAVNYCNQSKEIVESFDLTIERFNELTLQLQENSQFKNQVNAALIELQ
ncbi:MAG: DUF4168 domain-containing protein [Cyanobacteria bacterium J007]|jgi:hypothetical protein|nr:MAG: DUF4168 domain-containing protein [Cyanobacteria bacterium J007]